MTNKAYHQVLLNLARGVKVPYFPVMVESQIRYSDIPNLSRRDADFDTPMSLYQRTLASIQNTGIMFFGDPHNRINSKDIARTATCMKSGSRLIDVEICKEEFERGASIWDSEFQKNFGSIRDKNLYVLAGFENLGEEVLLNTFQFPMFEIGCEHFQERRGCWKGVDYNHGLLLIITGIAEEAFQEAGRKHQRGNGGNSVGTISNLLGRVQHANFYCIDE